MPPLKDPDFEKAYDDLRDAGQNTVEGLIKWLKDAKVLEMVDKSESEVQKMFDKADTQSKVSKTQFDDVINKLSKNNEKLRGEMEEMLTAMAAESEKVMAALAAAAEAGAKAYKAGNKPKTEEVVICTLL